MSLIRVNIINDGIFLAHIQLLQRVDCTGIENYTWNYLNLQSKL